MGRTLSLLSSFYRKNLLRNVSIYLGLFYSETVVKYNNTHRPRHSKSFFLQCFLTKSPDLSSMYTKTYGGRFLYGLVY